MELRRPVEAWKCPAQSANTSPTKTSHRFSSVELPKLRLWNGARTGTGTPARFYRLGVVYPIVVAIFNYFRSLLYRFDGLTDQVNCRFSRRFGDGFGRQITTAYGAFHGRRPATAGPVPGQIQVGDGACRSGP